MERPPLEKRDLDRLIKKIGPLKKAFDLLKDHAIITDKDGRILYANKAAEHSTGFPVAEMIGHSPGELWGGQGDKAFYAVMWRTIKFEKKPFVGEVHNKRKDGTLYWQELHISPILGRDGDVEFFIGIEPDISDRKEKEKFREEFISMLGHQLKTPTTTIRWTLETLLDAGHLDPDDYRSLKESYGESLLITDLINDILILSRLGGAAEAAEEFDLEDEIRKTVDLVMERNPQVTFAFAEVADRFGMKGNRTFARYVFTNIISNAAEYSAPGAGHVVLRLERTDDYDLFSCENDGTSIPAEDHARIFSKFFRASNASGRKEHGSGLGLYIVKMICDDFGWQVSFKSPARPDGTGTIFYVKMPRR